MALPILLIIFITGFSNQTVTNKFKAESFSRPFYANFGLKMPIVGHELHSVSSAQWIGYFGTVRILYKARMVHTKFRTTNIIWLINQYIIKVLNCEVNKIHHRNLGHVFLVQWDRHPYHNILLRGERGKYKMLIMSW